MDNIIDFEEKLKEKRAIDIVSEMHEGNKKLIGGRLIYWGGIKQDQIDEQSLGDGFKIEVSGHVGFGTLIGVSDSCLTLCSFDQVINPDISVTYIDREGIVNSAVLLSEEEAKDAKKIIGQKSIDREET